ncbi:MAG: hypothetical protein NTY42_15760, partial [Planctomycetota bacterium]|nr:hypothetical protein [Planctomycetota bacterium]
SDDSSKEPLLESKPNTSDNTEKRLKHSMGMTRQREWRLRIEEEFSFAVRMEKIASIYRNIHNPKRVSGGVQQKDLTTNNSNCTNRNTVNSSFA